MALDKALVDGMVLAVKEHALANYETGGWDYVVETMTDEEIERHIIYCRSGAGAIKKMGQLVKLLDDRRRDIQATAF